jgi:hypothetical protein
MEDVSSETLRVHSHEHAGVRLDIPEHESDMLVIVDIVAVADDAPRPDFCRETSFSDAVDEALGLKSMCDELSDSDESEAVFLRETFELGATGAGAVLAEDLADHSSGGKAGQPGKIDGRFRVTHALKYASLARSKRRDVARTAEVRWDRLGIDCDPDRLRAVLGAYSGRNAEALIGINADSEGGSIFVGVDFTLLSELQLVGALSSQRETYPSARFADHEVDHFGRDQLRRANEIALVLAIFIVCDDDQLAGLDIGYCLFDSSELHDFLVLQ